MEAEIWPSQVAHQGYLHLRPDRPSLNQIASGARAIDISNTDYFSLLLFFNFYYKS